MSGPMPKLDGERTRRNQPAGGPARIGEYRETKAPPADGKWHPRAKAFYKSLRDSGQSDYYQASDWAQARLVCDLMTHVYKQDFYRQAQMVETMASMMSKLGVTEADRRSLLRLELEHPAEEDRTPGDIAEDAYAQVLQLPVAGNQ